MLVNSQEQTRSVVLFCNPNAGYYEFTYFQSEWLEFYTAQGIDVLLWNYRGFGKSTGTPQLSELVEDGVCLIKFIKSHKNYQKIGIHGESLGGCIAIQIAAASECAFLCADRTFSNISDTILFKKGRLAYFCFKVSGFRDVNSVDTYLKLSCYKVITGDACDNVISDFASLKTGVALRAVSKHSDSLGAIFLNNKWKAFKCLLPYSDFKVLLTSLNNITSALDLFPIDSYTEKQQIIIKTEYFEELDLNYSLKKVTSALNEVDAGGMRLIDINKFDYPELRLFVWLISLELWGCFNDGVIAVTSNVMIKTIAVLRLSVLELKELQGFPAVKDIEVVINALETILHGIQEKGRTSSVSDQSSNEEEYRNVGFLLPIACGHNGQFSITEKALYQRHLDCSDLVF
jgi:alpha/beta superfamily hydrolase